ncbi:hypothetical protein LSTR_LSTR004547 [Laodelphax striatellus]|uniref:Uncharacterized protein n=1 Tax=Laodelphax striatellus TaxID=195883 RepID=A0A482WTD0_LAOST|nr:hypothetical protein LSTR_LSTR004547 [Laodelphax striatellus]
MWYSLGTRRLRKSVVSACLGGGRRCRPMVASVAKAESIAGSAQPRRRIQCQCLLLLPTSLVVSLLCTSQRQLFRSFPGSCNHVLEPSILCT